MQTALTDAPSQFLTFELAGEEFAVEILRVKEIIEYDHLTRVPGMPVAVRGVINLRGRVVPVSDLALRFGMPASEITRRSCIVMVEVGSDEGPLVVGMITDAVSEVLDVPTDRIQPPPSFGTRVEAPYLQGMAETGRKFVMLLDIDRTLGPTTFQAVHTLEENAAPADGGAIPETAG